MPEQSLSELQKLGFKHVGDFTKMGEGIGFSLSSDKGNTGSYAFVVDKRIMYIGVTKYTLYARMNGYKNPGPTQETNKRINPKISKAGRVQIYFLASSEITHFTTIIRRGDVEKQVPTDVNTFERFLISKFRPEWNRG